MTTKETPWSTDRFREEIRRWRSYGYSTEEILDAIYTGNPNLRTVATPGQHETIRKEIEQGKL